MNTVIQEGGPLALLKTLISVPLAALVPAFAGAAGAAQPSSKVIDAHLAVQATIRSYQVGFLVVFIETFSVKWYDTVLDLRFGDTWPPRQTR